MPCHDDRRLRGSVGPPSRPDYFEGQLLTADALRDEQAYARDKRTTHNRDVHGWGVVHGLEVTASEDGRVMVSPGMAIDPCGREIVVPAPVTVEEPSGGAVARNATGGGEDVEILVRYEERGVLEGSRIDEVSAFEVRRLGDGGRPLGVVLARAERAPDGRIIRIDPTRRDVAHGIPRLLELVQTLGERVAALEARLPPASE